MAETETSQTASYSWHPNSMHETELFCSFHRDVWTQHKVPVLPWKPGCPSDFAISVRSTWILPRIEPEIHLWSLPWLPPSPSPLVWALKQLLSVSTIWQFIIYSLINIALVKGLKEHAFTACLGEQIRNSLREGSGPFPPRYSTRGTFTKAPEIPVYRFSQQIPGEPPLCIRHSSTGTRAALGSVSLHSVKGGAEGSPKNSASVVLTYSLGYLRWARNEDLFPPPSAPPCQGKVWEEEC